MESTASTLATTFVETGVNVPEKTEGYHLRWSRLSKTVQVREASSGLLSSLIGDYNITRKENEGPIVKKILHNVSGFAGPGKVLGLMGPSGSGKTTLLNTLSGRSAYDGGIVSINGKILREKSMKRLRSKIAYVKQSDIFFDHLTAKEQLTYTALLRLPSTWEQSCKLDAVEQTLEMLRLQRVADSPIQLLSGGEKKRVNIGTELLTDPTILVLDEPTTGLDSTNAVALMELLRGLAKSQGKTVITSIHQPSSAVFRSFNKLMVLAEGHCVYFGTPVGSLAYLRQKNLACPDGYNAADYWMDLLVRDKMIDHGNENDVTRRCSSFSFHNCTNRSSALVLNTAAKHVREDSTPRSFLIAAWDNEAIATEMDGALLPAQGNDPLQNGKKEGGRDLVGKDDKKYNTSWTTQFAVLTHRGLRNSRSAIFTPLNLTKSVVLGILAGLLWFRLEYTENTVNDRSSYLFFSMTHWILDSMILALLAFPSEREVILKERASASYRLGAYFMAKTVSEAPTRLCLPVIYTCISYWMVGLNPRFSIFVRVVACAILSALAGESIGLFIGASIHDLARSLAVITVIALAQMLLGGFFVDNVPVFVNWARYTSPFKYAFDASRQLEFDRNMPCDGSGVLEEYCAINDGIATPAQVKKYLAIQGSFGFNVGMLVCIILISRWMAYLALCAKKG